ncbi:Uncharacterised protein [uncultured archaeon]|nr:Uncharacterised protein [uncultured archaeon]
MLTITELSDSLLYVESERWQCSFGHGEPVKLGLVLEAVHLGGGERGEYAFVMDASLIPQPEYLDEEIVEEAKTEGAKAREEQIRYAYEVYGGVPVNIDAVQPAKASCGFSSFVAESSIKSLKAGSDEEIEVRHFRDQEEAMRFARDFYAVYANVLFGFIDAVLDRSLPAGKTGWDRIRQMAKR